MNLLNLVNGIERFVDDSKVMDPHDKTVIHTKLLQLQIHIQETIQKHEKEKADLLAKLKKKTLDHKVSQALLKIQIAA